MATKLGYAEVLNEMLKRDISQCDCATKYMSSLKLQQSKVNSGECQFGPNCEFSSCKYDKSECTCQARCTCEPSKQKPESITRSSLKGVCTEPQCTCVGTCLCKPEVSRLSKSYLPSVSSDNSICICKGTCLCKSEESVLTKSNKTMIYCDKSKCICTETCFCKSEESLSKILNRPLAHCDKSKCICENTCLCKSDESLLSKSCKPLIHSDKFDKSARNVCPCGHHDLANHLFPNSFRNTVKEAFTLMSDEKIRKECAEIKKVLTEHKESIKKGPEKVSPQSSLEKEKEDKSHHNPKENKDTNVSTHLVPTEKQQTVPGNTNEDSKLTSPQTPWKSATKAVDDPKKDVKKKEKSHKKAKAVKYKNRMPLCSAKSKSTTFYSCGRASVKSKPPHIRFYYSGGTEHYGVKLGHKQCKLQPQLVPKNMGWLWNLEDPGKGIRDRKGWPPGFIGKSIKNMIKVMKTFEEVDLVQGVKKEDTQLKSKQTAVVQEKEEAREEPPLIHIHKKGRVYNITFCPKASDEDVAPIPIPFSITQKKHDSETESSESTLEFELHSPKLQKKPTLPQSTAKPKEVPKLENTETVTPPSTTKVSKNAIKKKSSPKK